MPDWQGVLLTGATGQLGQYLLKDLLTRGVPVAVLARDSRTENAVERIDRIVASWSDRLGQSLPAPVVLNGDLGEANLGLTSVDRDWVGRNCTGVVHSAASLSFRKSVMNEPWRTNVDGTKTLLEFCRKSGLVDWHQISTAFVCGRRTGRIDEDELDCGQSFHNDYEASKLQAEQLLRASGDMRVTIYRPSIIIGDSRTGYTSTFGGLYRFLDLAAQFASVKPREDGSAHPLRLPLNGSEPWNLVPVDYVSTAVTEMLTMPEWFGRTFHLVSRSTVLTKLIRDVGVQTLNLGCVEFSGSDVVDPLSRNEQLFRNGIREYWPYLEGNPLFSDANTRQALPNLSPPSVDWGMLERTMRFAVANRWGRGPIPAAATHAPVQPTVSSSTCAEYFEKTFPLRANRSRVAREARLNLLVGFDLRGPGGGQWSCQWNHGELVSVRRGLELAADVSYQMDTDIFHAVIHGTQSAHEAFFEQQIEITGDVEWGLKLAMLFGQFLAEDQSSHPGFNRAGNVTTSSV